MPPSAEASTQAAAVPNVVVAEPGVPPSAEASAHVVAVPAVPHEEPAAPGHTVADLLAFIVELHNRLTRAELELLADRRK